MVTRVDYFELLFQAIYRQIELQRWSIASFQSKAKTTISTGAVVLSITTVAIAGFAALLARTSLDPLALLESVFGELAVTAICLAVVGIAAIIGSMIVSIHALGGRPIKQILSSKEFETIKIDGPGDLPVDSVNMPIDELAYRLQHNAVDTIRTLEEYGGWIASKIHVGQILLLVGIGLVSAVPAVALPWTLLSRAPA